LLTALIHPLNLLMVGLSVLAGLIAAWWLFPVGVLFWLIMVIAVSRDPSLRISHQMKSRAPLAPRFQRYFDRIERSQVGVFNSLSSAPARTRRALRSVQAEIDALTQQVHALCRRMTVLENYRMVSQSQADLGADLQQLNAKIESAADPIAKQEYEESRQALQSRASKLEAVSTQLDRVEAQLMSLANEMDGVVTEVIRLQAMGHDDAARHVPELVERLREQGDQLKRFERERVDI
jgi:chromosome segregation ATPase